MLRHMHTDSTVSTTTARRVAGATLTGSHPPLTEQAYNCLIVLCILFVYCCCLLFNTQNTTPSQVFVCGGWKWERWRLQNLFARTTSSDSDSPFDCVWQYLNSNEQFLVHCCCYCGRCAAAQAQGLQWCQTCHKKAHLQDDDRYESQSNY